MKKLIKEIELNKEIYEDYLKFFNEYLKELDLKKKKFLEDIAKDEKNADVLDTAVDFLALKAMYAQDLSLTATKYVHLVEASILGDIKIKKELMTLYEELLPTIRHRAFVIKDGKAVSKDNTLIDKIKESLSQTGVLDNVKKQLIDGLKS